MILAIFDLQVTPMLPTKFQINWPFSSGEEVQNRFSRWQPSSISYQNDFSYFDLKVTSMILSKFQVNWPFSLGEEMKKHFQDGCHGVHHGFLIGTILAIFDLPVSLMLHTKLCQYAFRFRRRREN